MYFYAHPNRSFTWDNGAIGYRPCGNPSFDCLGPYAKVSNCPIDGYPELRLTCYATGYADTYFSIPAKTRYRGKHIGGFFMVQDDNIVFVPHEKFKGRLN